MSDEMLVRAGTPSAKPVGGRYSTPSALPGQDTIDDGLPRDGFDSTATSDKFLGPSFSAPSSYAGSGKSAYLDSIQQRAGFSKLRQALYNVGPSRYEAGTGLDIVH